MENLASSHQNYWQNYSAFHNHNLWFPHQIPSSEDTFKQQYQKLKLRYDSLLVEHQQLKQKYQELEQKTTKKRQVRRRNQSELNKNYSCPYSNCKKQYASDYALNLHIKKKHDGGNKKDRDRAAMMILKCEKQGTEHPNLPLKLPPNYVEENRIRLMLMDSDQLSGDSSLSE